MTSYTATTNNDTVANGWGLTEFYLLDGDDLVTSLNDVDYYDVYQDPPPSVVAPGVWVDYSVEAENDLIDLGGGNDTIVVGAGNDTLRGGDGFDILNMSNSVPVDPTFSKNRGPAATSEYLDQPTITVDLKAGTATSTGVTGKITVTQITVYGEPGVEKDFIESGLGDFSHTLTGFEAVQGSIYSETFLGSNAEWEFYLLGSGLGGQDTIDGRAGSDVVSFTGFYDVDANLKSGTATVFGPGTDNTTTHSLTNVEGLVGARGNDTLRGDGKDNLFVGSSGSDNIDGAKGDDTLAFDLSHISDGLGSFYDRLLGVEVDLDAGTATYISDVDTLTSIENVIGSAGGDTLSGDKGGNVIEGRDGNDTVKGQKGNDTLTGDAGDDLVEGGGGVDVIDGGDGNDTINGGSDADILKGNAGYDSIIGGSGDDLIFGDDGPDAQDSGLDTLEGGDGKDTIYGYDKADMLKGGDRDDDLFGGKGDDLLQGGKHDDNLMGEGGKDTLEGGKGNDTLDGGSGDDVIDGENGNDYLLPGAGVDVMRGGKGKDTLDLDGAVSAVDLDLDGKTLDGGGFDGNTVRGIEVVLGSKYNDTLAGGSDAEEIFGEKGKDTVRGGGGDDTLQGGDGKDRIEGGKQDDELFGGSQNDKLFGDGGSDRLDGGEGSDTLTGGSGTDYFVFGPGTTTVTDFNPDEDYIDISGPFDDFATPFFAYGAAINVGSDVHITSNGNLMILENMQIGSFNVDVFWEG